MNNFKFAIPCEIKKGKDINGKDVYKFKGKASSRRQDSQGETLDPETFILDEFKVINWNHQSAKDASAYIGEPTKTIIKDGEMFIEGELYPEMEMTKHVVSLMKALKKRGKNLCLSVEGKVVERGSEDKASPLYKIIKRAKITGCAITPHPINGDTFCELIEKGFTATESWDVEEEVEDLVKSFIYKSLDGGLADDMTIEDIAKKHKVDLSYAKKMLQQGISVEMEHTDDEDTASEISLDHLFEDIEYYNKLKKVEGIKKSDDIEDEEEEEDEQLDSEIENDEDDEQDLDNKAMDTQVPVVKESVEKKQKSLKKIEKSDLYDKIFSYFYDINIVKAKKIGQLCEKIAEMENKELTEEHINKAFEILGVVSNLEKGDKSEKMEMDSNEEEEEVYKGYKKSKIEKACTMYKGMGSDEMKKAMLEDGFESKFVDVTCDYANKEANGGNTEIKKGDIEDLIQKSFGNIENLVKGSSEQVSAKFSAMADIFRAQEARLESLAKSLEVSNNLTGELQDRLNKVESQPNLRKSVTSQRFVERFAKSEDGKDLYSLSDSRSRQDLVSTLNDLSGIRKGENFDKELVEIAQEIELTKSISARGVQKLNSLNIEVHK